MREFYNNFSPDVENELARLALEGYPKRIRMICIKYPDIQGIWLCNNEKDVQKYTDYIIEQERKRDEFEKKRT